MQTPSLAEELRAMQPIVEEITGLNSRWNGQVSVMDTTTMLLLKGKFALAEKEWACSIIINEAIAADAIRWRSLLHEMLHSVSVGANSADYERFRGWEEAVVEQVQRQIRPVVLARLQIRVEESIFAQVEQKWPYNTDVTQSDYSPFCGRRRNEFLRWKVRLSCGQTPTRVLCLRSSHSFCPAQEFIPAQKGCLRNMSNNYIEAMEALRLSLGLSAEAFYLTLLQTPLGDRLNYVRSLSEDREFRRLFAFTVGKLR